MRPVRNHAFCRRNSGGEHQGRGRDRPGGTQHPLRRRARLAADHHTIAKHAVKEIAWQQGRAASFLAKWSHDRVGSATHVHQSLWKEGKPAFFDAKGDYGMSETMRQYMAGLIAYAPDYTFFLAPYVNSYKRFMKGTFAPTKTVWSVDNRTAGFRLCGEGTKGVRVECRIGGSDINPYLALAAMMAAGIKGIEDKLELAPPNRGDIYENATPSTSPRPCAQRRRPCGSSKMLREAMGDAVVDHYVRCAEWEQEEFDKARHRLGNRPRFRTRLTGRNRWMRPACPGIGRPEGAGNEQFETDIAG
jgi:glutamine synthetase